MHKLNREDIQPFLQAQTHNTNIFKEQMKTRRLCDADYFFYSMVDGYPQLRLPGLHGMDVIRQINDIIVGSIYGAIPCLDLHGYDGLKVDHFGYYSYKEFKLCMKSSDRFTINSNGNITVLESTSESDKAKSFRSDCAAHYEIVENLEKKNIGTVFTVIDKDNWEIIAVYEMTGDKIVELVGKNQRTGEDKSSKKRSVSLSSFMRLGNELFFSDFNSIGVVAWEDRIYSASGKTRPEAVKNWTDEQVEQLRELYKNKIAVKNIASIMDRSITAITSKLSKSSIRRN